MIRVMVRRRVGRSVFGWIGLVSASLAMPAAAQNRPLASAPPPVAPPAPTNGVAPHAPTAATTLNSSVADNGPHFTLGEAIALMARSHPLLAAARANIRSAEFNVRAAGLWTNPSLSVSYGRSLTATATYDDRFGSLSLALNQFFETENLPGARRDVAEHERRATVADMTSTMRGLMFDLTSAYFALVEATTRRGILEETASELAEAQRVVNARVAAGASPHYDYSRMSIAMADARASVSDSIADGVGARGSLNVAVGPDAARLQGSPAFDLNASPSLPALSQILDAVVNNRADIVAARHRVAEASAQIAVAHRTVFQGITGSAGVALGASSPMAGVTTPSVDVFVGATIPLTVIDHGQGTVPAAEARAMALTEQLNAMQLEASQVITAAYNEVVSRREALQAYVDSGAADSFAMRREAQAAYREGRIQVLDLVDAYTAVRDARLRLLSLGLDARNAEVNLWRAAGNVLDGNGRP